MAPLEEVTSARVYQILGVALVVSSVALGITSLYYGLTRPPDEVFFGVDSEIVTGVWWLLSAVVWAVLYRRIVRHEATVDE